MGEATGGDMVREGEYSRGRIPVESHAMDIPKRVKEIDGDFFIMLNVGTQRFEVWRAENGSGVLECVLPYDGLDERAVRHVREHRIERLETLAREVEEHNRRLEEGAKRRWLEEAGERTKEAFAYLGNKAEEEIPVELLEESASSCRRG